MKSLETYTPAGLYVAHARRLEGYSVDEAVSDYMKLHPGADEPKVRHEIEAVAD